MEEEQQFKVAPIMSDDKVDEFKYNIMQTITGIHQDNISWHRIEELLLLFPITFIVPLVVSNKIIAIVIPTAVNVLLNLIEDLFRQQQIKVGHILLKNFMLGVYTFLWASHIYFLSQFCNDQVFNIVLSAVSIFTSIYTIARHPVKEFSANGLQNTQIGWNSTLFMRLFISLPTLVAEFIIFNSWEQTGISPSNVYLLPLRLINSLIFVTWMFGWVSSINNTLFFIANKIGMLILGNQSQHTFKYSVLGIIYNMIPIAIYELTYHLNSNVSLMPLIIGATVTSIFTFFRYNIFIKSMGTACIRPVLLLIIQSAVCILLVLLYKLVDLENVSLSIFLGIDIGIYFIFKIIKQLLKGWSIFGISSGLQCLKLKYVSVIERILLRIFSGISILLIYSNYRTFFLAILPYNANILYSIAIPFLFYRSFKRSISETTSFSLHISLLICLILINTGAPAQGTLLALMMPPFPPSMWIALVSIFQIPPKLQHKNQCLYKIFYFVATFLSICLHLLSLGSLQLTMLFGLPVYWPIIPTQTEGYEVKSVENSLYQKILQNIDKELFQFYETGYYLLRIEKYILLLEVKSNCFGFCQLIDIRGLQVQEVTSCHSKEGETIDKLVEETWGDNKLCCSLSPLQVALTPYLKEKVYVPTENDIQLVGIIETKQFIQLFKQTALKSILREYSKISLNQTQTKQTEIITSEFSALFKKEAAEKLFPFEFAKQCNLGASYPTQSGKIKLPPLNSKTKKPEVINDFLDLLENSHNDKFQSSNTALNEKQKSEQSKKQSNKELKRDEMNMAVVLTFYYYAIGKQDYINTQKLYKLIKRESDVISQIEFQHFNKIISLALGAAFKISVDKYIEGELQVSLDDFVEYDKNSFLGTSDSEEFKKSILENKEHVWNINYSKKTLIIKRLAHSETNMYIFKVSQAILKAVWNNLRFELIYATNNNDERYSIQTHPGLLRNLWVEACEEPFGYPSYHSGLMILS